MNDQERELVASLERALACADALCLRLVAIKIAEALERFRLEKHNGPPPNEES
jgi:hypothetical protein